MEFIMTLTKLTKAQLIARINEVEAQLLVSQRNLQVTREDLAMQAKQVPIAYTEQPVRTHKAYYDYVRQCRLAQRGRNVISYMTFSQWCAA